MSKVKLTSAQIFILEEMQKGRKLYYSRIYQTFRMNGKPVNRLVVLKLENLGLVQKGEADLSGSYDMHLTDAAKSIEL